MTNRFVAFISVLLFSLSTLAQKSKVQTAWRSLSDYEESVKNGDPEIKYLNKANDAIEAALNHDDTKKQTKTHAYKLRIRYAMFQKSVADEMKKLEPSVQNKEERALAAYGNVSLQDFDKATEALNTIKETDPKYLENIQDALATGTSKLDNEDLSFAAAVQQMKMESGNIASGKYKVKKYDEAADYFYQTAVINTILFKNKDTANFSNACISAAKAKNTEKILEYNKKMIDARIATPYNYESLFNAHLSKGDSSAAINALKKGRNEFPEDAGLLTQETNLFLSTGRHQDALGNLKESVKRDPNNALYYFIIGNIYDNLANPKDKVNGKELEKPAAFDEYFKEAETNYQKAIQLNPANKDYLYNALYNLGAMYNNHGGYIAGKNTGKIADAAKHQKQNELQAQEFYKKAIPNLESALQLKPDDMATMTALRKLYLLTGNDAKGKEMNEKIKAGK